MQLLGLFLNSISEKQLTKYTQDQGNDEGLNVDDTFIRVDARNHFGVIAHFGIDLSSNQVIR